jgi:peptide/nickel transport system ATP-binding protein
MSDELLRVDDLVVEYPSGRRRAPVRANDHVSIAIGGGKTLGLVGESGSGKSTLGDAVLGFAPVTSGTIHFKGEEIAHATPERRRELTRLIQPIFQNPFGSLNPARTIGQTLREPLLAHGMADSREALERVARWLDIVGMPAESAERYPADFSGGQRQRIAIARALIVEPELIVCDEAVSALDLSIQAQVLNLLATLQETTGVSYLFISHDMAVVEYMADDIAVLHHGRIVEQGPAAQIAHHPTQEYTRALLAAVPLPDPALQRARKATRLAQR